jgi:RNA polymerase sigma factor for flagellar operon FliA
VVARVEGALDLVDAIARRLHRTIGSPAALEDLVSVGRMGLLEAARRYDPDRGVPFRAFAAHRIRGAVLDGMRRLGHAPRRAYARMRGVEAAARVSEAALEDLALPPPPGSGPSDADRQLGDHLAAMATAMAVGLLAAPARGEDGLVTAVDDAPDPEELTSREQLLALVRAALTELPADEAALVRRHYLEGEQFDEVARDLGISKSWASRLHTRAIQRLTRRLGGGLG